MSTNQELRARANEVARIAAKAIGLDFVPLCKRITRRRGHGRPSGFSVPVWAASHPVYFAYYAAHEVCHAHEHGLGNGHNLWFRRLELKALAAIGLEPVYQNDNAGPYVNALKCIKTGNVLCVRLFPANPVDPPNLRNQTDKENHLQGLTSI